MTQQSTMQLLMMMIVMRKVFDWLKYVCNVKEISCSVGVQFRCIVDVLQKLEKTFFKWRLAKQSDIRNIPTIF